VFQWQILIFEILRKENVFKLETGFAGFSKVSMLYIIINAQVGNPKNNNTKT